MARRGATVGRRVTSCARSRGAGVRRRHRAVRRRHRDGGEQVAVAAQAGPAARGVVEGGAEQAGEAGAPAQRGEPRRVAREVGHAQPAGDEQDAGLGRHREPGPLEHAAEDGPRVRLLEAVAVEADVVEQGDEQGPQEGVAAVGHADDGDAAGAQHPEDLAEGAVGVVEVLDGAHRVDGVEAAVAEGQGAHVALHAVQHEAVVGETPAGVGDDGRRDVDAERPRPLAGGPAQDAGVLGLVPEVGLEEALPGEGGQEGAQQPALVVSVLGGRPGASQVGEVLADIGPEALVLRVLVARCARPGRTTGRPAARPRRCAPGGAGRGQRRAAGRALGPGLTPARRPARRRRVRH